MRAVLRGDGAFREAVWASSDPPGVEHCKVRRTDSGWAIVGSLVRSSTEGVAVVTYTIETDRGWKTRGVSVEQTIAGRRRALKMVVRGSSWSLGGEDAAYLEGCADVDLNASPVTNTLPILRTKLEIGSRVDLTAAWVKFPSLEVAPLRQSYERLGQRRYLYRSASGFESEIEVDDFGLVKRYGVYWLAV
jgi:uncharacterized protein